MEEDEGDRSEVLQETMQHDEVEASVAETGIDTVTNIEAKEKQHFIVSTLVGPVCTHEGCMTQLGIDSGGNFVVSYNTIHRHLKRKRCGTANAKELERSIRWNVQAIH